MNTRTMTETLSLARENYVPNGKGQSVDNGDAVSQMLRSYDIVQVCELTDIFARVERGTHWAKYQHLRRWDGELNTGAIRMNCGNVIRGAWRRMGYDSNARPIR